ncbi:hypothetical protein SCP_0703860 [Sparassis crispa]|uniref:Uncharacterized protein n=1 Tax=Sparassis crispa TaxID=139825 RepID=A0A401GSP8_9APHY|nr:hypothetical protein SCP_0703860 [Sparassis crispa]GBE85200.1 hypothetical protein SCP_0703860 [Sparassis crispa]
MEWWEMEWKMDAGFCAFRLGKRIQGRQRKKRGEMGGERGQWHARQIVGAQDNKARSTEQQQREDDMRVLQQDSIFCPSPSPFPRSLTTALRRGASRGEKRTSAHDVVNDSAKHGRLLTALSAPDVTPRHERIPYHLAASSSISPDPIVSVRRGTPLPSTPPLHRTHSPRHRPLRQGATNRHSSHLVGHPGSNRVCHFELARSVRDSHACSLQQREHADLEQREDCRSIVDAQPLHVFRVPHRTSSPTQKPEPTPAGGPREPAALST